MKKNMSVSNVRKKCWIQKLLATSLFLYVLSKTNGRTSGFHR